MIAIKMAAMLETPGQDDVLKFVSMQPLDNFNETGQHQLCL